MDKLAHGKRKLRRERKIVVREPILAVPSRSDCGRESDGELGFSLSSRGLGPIRTPHTEGGDKAQSEDTASWRVPVQETLRFCG